MYQSELLISVIVTAYNIESYLPRCLDSLIAQTYQRLEIIVVDDGSTDRTGQICDRYAAECPRISVIHKENGGPLLPGMPVLRSQRAIISAMWMVMTGWSRICTRKC